MHCIGKDKPLTAYLDAASELGDWQAWVGYGDWHLPRKGGRGGAGHLIVALSGMLGNDRKETRAIRAHRATEWSVVQSRGGGEPGRGTTGEMPNRRDGAGAGGGAGERSVEVKCAP